MDIAILALPPRLLLVRKPGMLHILQSEISHIVLHVLLLPHLPQLRHRQRLWIRTPLFIVEVILPSVAGNLWNIVRLARKSRILKILCKLNLARLSKRSPRGMWRLMTVVQPRLLFFAMGIHIRIQFIHSGLRSGLTLASVAPHSVGFAKDLWGGIARHRRLRYPHRIFLIPVAFQFVSSVGELSFPVMSQIRCSLEGRILVSIPMRRVDLVQLMGIVDHDDLASRLVHWERALCTSLFMAEGIVVEKAFLQCSHCLRPLTSVQAMVLLAAELLTYEVVSWPDCAIAINVIREVRMFRSPARGEKLRSSAVPWFPSPFRALLNGALEVPLVLERNAMVLLAKDVVVRDVAIFRSLARHSACRQ
mmetsp:Transcript_74251/g.135625  ORF Transcript_74251/g.135625 Transcript_74251/m.135625 type:complete len:363 (-) Transcript_74251:132-1220(-)